ncbi:hypothetical protein ES695_07775 [Candidatus Atribacteria bacterium 1244-E10-H5-B2]|nr:MAG: hypothetical protein ES695_07775 [Candidatus Atribacteria bacterium 1244-E10-H5-B2]
MLKISLIFLAFIAFFVLILKVVIIQMERLTGKYVGEKHRAIEEIVNTGKVPKAWIDKLEKRISSVSKTQGRSKKVLKMKIQAKTIILKKIDLLIDYSKTSPFVQDKETKEILLNKLLDTRRLWEEKDWEEIIASPE